jgi:arylsulfatase A-like enzyme
MLESLEKRGLLANTVVIVTSDHGMPFPRGKGDVYEASNHVPLAIMWPKGIEKPGRTVDDFVSFIDIAPTLIELANLPWEKTGMAPTTGRSLVEILRSPKAGQVVADRDHVLIGKERNDVGRPGDGGYPVRGIVTKDWLYRHNFETDRWPMGNPEAGYLDTDGGRTKTEILAAHRNDPAFVSWHLCFGKRPADELYDLRKDADCVINLAAQPDATLQRDALRDRLFTALKAQADPRMEGQGSVFDQFPHSSPETRNFYERLMSGEKVTANWINQTDFEPKSTTE